MMSVIRTAAQHGAGAIDYLAARARSPDPGLAILLGLANDPLTTSTRRRTHKFFNPYAKRPRNALNISTPNQRSQTSHPNTPNS